MTKQFDLDNSITQAQNEVIEATIRNSKKFIYCSFQKEGYHCFPEAATDPQFATGDEYDVSHLATKHFHYFVIKVWLEVKHTNRDVEFIQFRRWLESLYGNKTLSLDSKSCEMIAEDLFRQIAIKYPNCEIRIDVAEMKEMGAIGTHFNERDLNCYSWLRS